MKKVLSIIVLVVLSLLTISCNKETLKAPTNLRYSNNELSWDAVDGANRYEYTILQGETETLKATTGALKVTLSLEVGTYSATIIAKGEDKLDSLKSEPIIIVIEAVVIPKLGTPTGLKRVNNIISWDLVEGATGYSVGIDNSSKVTVTTTNYTLPELELGNHTVKVVAKGTLGATIDSEEATLAITVTITLDTVDSITYSSDTDILTFSRVTGNDGYLVTVTKDEVLVLERETITESLSLNELGKGTYTVSIIAFGDNLFVLDSLPKTEIIEIVSRGVLENHSSLEISNGYLTWVNVAYTTTNVLVKELVSGTTVDVTPKFYNSNHLFLTDLGLEDGDYSIYVNFLSNRHDTLSSDPVRIDITIKEVVYYSAAEIANFSGTAPLGEHATASLIDKAGVPYAEIAPTADGWGRVGSPLFEVNFQKKPIVLLSIGDVIGGYHMQVNYDSNYYSVLGDTLRQGGLNVSLVTGSTSSVFVGVGEISLRLGVNSSVLENDARVQYEYIGVYYVNEYEEENIITDLENVTNIDVKLNGAIGWDVTANATGYRVIITQLGTNENILNSIIESPQVIVNLYDPATYLIEVTAVNATYSVESQVPTTYKFVISEIIRFDEIDTSADWTSENIFASYDSSTTYSTINSTGISNYGWVFSPLFNVNMDRNPFIIINVISASGGYFMKNIVNGSDAVMINDTPASFTTPRIISLRANVNVDRQGANTQDFSGIQSLKVGPGVMNMTPPSSLVIDYIKVIYIQKYEEVGGSVNLNPVSNFGINRSTLQFGVPSNAQDFEPKYDITIKNALDSTEVYSFTNQVATSVSLQDLLLTGNKTYDVSVIARGDNDTYFDSETATVSFTFKSIYSISDFTETILNVDRMGDLENFSQSIIDAKIKLTLTAGWGIPSFDLNLGEPNLLSSSSLIIVRIGEVEGGASIAGRLFKEATGDSSDGLMGDQSITTNQNLVLFENIGIAQHGTYVYLGLGFGGGSSLRSYIVNAIEFNEYKLVS
ncbi:MAG: hypothetical protein LBV58_03910 [Acholeplasmatales bacterium]|jgi:hypothetical protein|nr:hypothetical protein [Acholeplasmatales bacterium]